MSATMALDPSPRILGRGSSRSEVDGEVGESAGRGRASGVIGSTIERFPRRLDGITLNRDDVRVAGASRSGVLATRSAIPADVHRLIDFWATAGENDERPADRPDLVSRLIDHDADSVIITEDEGVLVGTVICGWDGWRASIYRLAVAPGHRRRGIATLLLQAAEQRLAELGAERFHAMVLNHNELGHSLWRAAGYEPQATWSRWVKPAPVSGAIGGNAEVC